MAKTDLVTSKTPKKDGPTLATRDEPRAEENAEKSPGVYLKNNVPPENSSDAARGMKSAVRDHEMVSLATFEDAPFVAVPKTEEDPVVTSANRLSMVTSPSEKSAIPLIEGRGSGSGTASQDFSAGLPFSSPVANPEAKTAATGKASALLTSFTSEIDKFHQTGQSQIQLELPVGEKESVKIRLHLRAGEVHSTFITESPELRDALQKAWPDFTATHRIPGLRFGDSQFQDSFTQNQDATPEQGRQRFSAQDLNPAPSKPTTSRNPQTSSNLSRSPSNSGSGRMNLWA
ncbi:MAG: flagellar hook-length control protein FliK [bacterium]